jgi:hypothetical protein
MTRSGRNMVDMSLYSLAPLRVGFDWNRASVFVRARSTVAFWGRSLVTPPTRLRWTAWPPGNAMSKKDKVWPEEARGGAVWAMVTRHRRRQSWCTELIAMGTWTKSVGRCGRQVCLLVLHSTCFGFVGRTLCNTDWVVHYVVTVYQHWQGITHAWRIWEVRIKF